MLSLAAQGQEAFIEEIAKNKSPGEFIQALKGDGSAGKDTNIDQTVFKKQVVFAVTKKLPSWARQRRIWSGEPGPDQLTLADRINNLKITLDAQKTGVFESWDKFVTLYGTVDLGTITRLQKSTANLEAYIGPAAQSRIPGQIKGTLGEEKDITEAVKLQQQYIKIAGAIEPDKQKATLYQEGAVGIDLTGTFSVDFTLQAPAADVPARVVQFRSLRKDGKTDQKSKSGAKQSGKVESEEVQIDFADLKYAKDTAPIICKFSYEYLLRHVVAKEDETAEGYHDVQFWHGDTKANPGEVTLVSTDQLKAWVFRVITGNTVIELKYPGEEPFPLQFATFAKAHDFLRWIKESRQTTIGKYKLCYDKQGNIRDLNKSEIDSLIIKAVAFN